MLHHQPVLIQEFLDALPVPASDSSLFLLDCTVGAGGHSHAFLQKYPQGKVWGLDQDDEMLAIAHQHLQEYRSQVTLKKMNFRNLSQLRLPQKPHAILMDLGISSIQLDQGHRGFSFQTAGPLDMRMDRQQSLSAQTIVNSYSEKEIADLLYFHADERYSRRIARAIVEQRRHRPFETTLELAQLVLKIYKKRSFIHPATRTFQALRMEVNQELSALQEGLVTACELVAEGGRVIVISFHSGEDRLVKHTLRLYQKELKKMDVLTKKPIKASEKEQKENPRSRSACLRIGEKRLCGPMVSNSSF